MRRVALFNLAFGFLLIFIAASGGAFVALSLTESFVSGALNPTWQSAIETSSHGHTSLFGMIHILMGLTMPYARASATQDLLKTLGMTLGSLAMGPLLLIRGALGPTLSTEWNGMVVGICLSLALAAIFWHAAGLSRRLLERS